MARGIWKGTLGFGLVNIGVELLPAEAAAERLDPAAGEPAAHRTGRHRPDRDPHPQYVAEVYPYAVEWNPGAFSDTYKKDILKLVRERARGGGRKVRPAAEEAEETHVLDLMAALKRSVASHGRAGTRPKRRVARSRAEHRKSA